VPGVGFEPTRPLGPGVLSPLCLTKFHHPGWVIVEPFGYTAAMAKVLFIPVSIGGGLLAGFVGKKVFDQVWGLIDEEEPPDSKHRDISWGRLLLAGAIQGAIFRAVKEATDHAARRGFYRTTGTWPGEKRPDPE
jgi:Protein of unknown function (DUF4235)